MKLVLDVDDERDRGTASARPAPPGQRRDASVGEHRTEDPDPADNSEVGATAGHRPGVGPRPSARRSELG